jgi:thiosulfate/3-mercaptopyruvate sulfurtransferase
MRIPGLLALVAVLALGLSPANAAEPLVDADWLHANLDRDDLVVLDVRNELDGGSAEAFAQGHIPGAVYSDYLQAGWRTARDGIPAQLPPVDELERLIGGLGISNDDHVVVVSAGNSALDMGSATRVYWTFKVLGHDRASVLDGGIRAYGERYDLAQGEIARQPTAFKASFRPEMLADREAVSRALDEGVALIDYRPEAHFRGEAKAPAATQYGTIPGARNIADHRLVRDDGRFVDATEAAGLLSEVGTSSEADQITFCNTGHWASLGWFVMHEIVGNTRTKLFDGSMVEWTMAGGETEMPGGTD